LNQLRKRQRDECAVILVATNDDVVAVGTHIIRRSITREDDSGPGLVSTNSRIFLFLTRNFFQLSLPATWDILRQYVDLSDEFIRGLQDTVDSPSNGILLDIGMHKRFNDFAWYFEPTVCIQSFQYSPLTHFDRIFLTSIK
jgi:hypothetical protein